jgi:hypothetical protein
MKSFKTRIIGLIAIAIIFSAGILKADNNQPSTVSDLKIQIQKEIIDVFKTPVWLNFEDKNLNGTAQISIAVDMNGKISLKSVECESSILATMITNKIKSLNLWTDTKFAGQSFNYKIVSKQV